MPEPDPRRLSDADAMFLTTEEAAGVPFAPVSISFSEGGHDADALAHLMEVSARLLPAQRRRIAHDRFSIALPRWVDVPGFDPQQNAIRLPAPPGDGSIRALLDWAAEWSQLPMDPERPPWRSVTFENVHLEGRTVEATVSQSHHAIIDGQGATRLGQAMLQFEPDGPLPEMPPPVAPDTTTAGARWKQGWAEEGAKVVRHARRAGRWARWAASEPAAGAGRARDWAGALRRLNAAQGSRARSPLFVRRSRAVRFDVVDVDWDAFRAGTKAVGGSVNDGFMGALSVGLHRYHLEHGIRVPALNTAMAINTRREDDPHGGNRVIGVMLPLPLHDDAAIAIKESRELSRTHRDDVDLIRLTDTLRAFANRLPQRVATWGTRKALSGIDLQISNVQGIPVRYWVAGVESLGGFSFATGGPGLSMTLISSRGTAVLGVATCPEAVKDPEHLADCLRHGFAAVGALAP